MIKDPSKITNYLMYFNSRKTFNFSLFTKIVDKEA